MTGIPEILKDYLKEQKRRSFIRSFISALCVAAGIGMFVTGGMIIFLHNIYPDSLFILSIIALVIGLLIFLFLWVPVSRIARTLSSIDSETGEMITSALELSKEWGEKQESEEWTSLAREFFDSVETRIKEQKDRVKVPISPPIPFYLLPGVAMFFFLPVFLRYSWTGGRYEFVKPIKAEINPPSYTLINPYTISENYVLKNVPVGSTVTLKFEVKKEIERVKVLYNKKVEVPDIRDFEVIFPFSITSEENFEIKILGKRGVKWFENSRVFNIEVRRDKIPEVKLISPQEDLVLKNNRLVDIAFDAFDDYGITSSRLACRRENGKVDNTNLPAGKEIEKHILITHSHNFSYLNAGEKVDCWIEVFDNDSVRGPKAGKSKVFSIEIFSAKKMLMEALDSLSELLNKTVDILAIQIEKVLYGSPSFNRKGFSLLDEREDELFYEYDNLFDRIKNESAGYEGEIFKIINGYEDLKSAVKLRRHYTNNTKQVKKMFKNEMENTERFILLVDTNWRSETLSFLKEEIENLLKEREKLLTKLQKGGNPEEILKQLENITKEIENMLSKVAQSIVELPSDYLNPVDSGKIRAGFEGRQLLEEIKKALREGNREKARELLNQYFNMLKELSNSLNNLSGEMAYGGMEGFKTFGEVFSEINAIKERQKRLRNQHLSELARQNGIKKEDIEKMINQMKKYLQMSRNLYEEAMKKNAFPFRFPHIQEKLNATENRFNKMELELEEGNFDNLKDNAELQIEDLSNLSNLAIGGDNKKRLKNSRSQIQKLYKILERLSGLKVSYKTKNNLKQEQDRLSDKLNKISRKADELGSDNLMKNIEKAGQCMQGAAKNIGEEKNAQALKKEENALKHLKNAKNELEKMMEKMNGKRLLSLRPYEEGYQTGKEIQRGAVAIPAEEKSKIKDKFRKNLKEAVREGLPEEKKNYNEKYYNELVE